MYFTTASVITALALGVSALPNPLIADSTIAKRYVPGWCGAHIIQYQLNEGPGSDTSVYRLTIELKDANGADLGGVNTVEAPSGVEIDVDSDLPAVFIATTGYKDSDPIQFAYNGEGWDSTSDQCSLGGYAGGSRQIDCGFTC